MSKKDIPDPDNPFLAIDKSLFAKEKQQGRDHSYTKNRDLKKAAKSARALSTENQDDDSQYFSDLMNMGKVEKLKSSPKVNFSQINEAAPVAKKDELDDFPEEWLSADSSFFEPEPEIATPRELKISTPTPVSQPEKGDGFGSMAGLLESVKVKEQPQPEPEDKGHDHKQEDKMLKEYLASARKRPGGPDRAGKNRKTDVEQPAAAPGEPEDDFSLAMREVTPLSGKGREVIPEPPKPNPAIIPANPLQDFIDGKVEFSLEFTEEFIQGHVLGLDPAIMGKLRAGAYSYEAHLDLHGLNSAQAFDSLVAFIKQSYMTGKRTVLVIPGRGKKSPDGSGILRDKLEAWLPQDPFKRVVLAFCTALPKHGGPGAIYVMLRKFKKSRGKIHWDYMPSDPDLFI